jgi:uncharacterized protein (TIGR03435 family)
MSVKRNLLVPTLAIAAFGQTGPATFEVASVKVANPNPQPSAGGARIASGCRRPTGGSVQCNNATLKTILMQAYGVKAYQVEGPAWLESEHYDVMAKIPEGVAVEQVAAMMQALLAERFKVVLHKDSRMLPAYDLTIAKGGIKMKEVDAAEVAAHAAGTAPPAPKAADRNAMPALGSFTVRMSNSGARTERGKMSMAQITNLLSNTVGRPVTDQTGLTGTYEMELTYMGDPPALPGNAAVTPPADSPIATIFQAVQESLGLKLEPKKAPLDVLVIESANKVPTEN